MSLRLLLRSLTLHSRHALRGGSSPRHVAEPLRSRAFSSSTWLSSDPYCRAIRSRQDAITAIGSDPENPGHSNYTSSAPGFSRTSPGDSPHRSRDRSVVLHPTHSRDAHERLPDLVNADGSQFGHGTNASASRARRSASRPLFHVKIRRFHEPNDSDRSMFSTRWRNPR